MSLSDELDRLAQLHARGALTDEEFARAKESVLSGNVRRAAMDVQQSLNHLRRSTRDQYFGGVCGGFAEATGLPSWLWRAIFVVMAASVGIGIVVYLVLWGLIPLDTDDSGPTGF